MKKTGIKICLAALLISLFTATCFAETGLEIVEEYPVDGQKGTSVENVSVKMKFSDPVSGKETQEANNGCFELLDSDGNSLPIKVYYNDEDPSQVLVLFDTANTENIRIQGNREYTVRISGDFRDDEGDTLGSEKVITFRTLNQKMSNYIYFGLMIVMMGGMILLSTRQARKKAMEDAESGSAERDEPFNPYREAKRTGKPLDQVIAEHEKQIGRRKAKEAKKAAGREAENDDDYDDEDNDNYNGNYKVKGPRPIAAGGGRYITGRKAAAEARAAEEERLARRRSRNNKKK